MAKFMSAMFFCLFARIAHSGQTCETNSSHCNSINEAAEESEDMMQVSLLQQKRANVDAMARERRASETKTGEAARDQARSNAMLEELGTPVFEVRLAKDEVSAQTLAAREERLRNGPVIKLYHETDLNSCRAIVNSRFYNGKGGLVGGGVYFAVKARDVFWKSQKKGCMIESWVAIGNEYRVAYEGDKSLNGPKVLNMNYDSVWIPRGCSHGPCLPSPAPERIVYYSDQILEMSAYPCTSYGQRKGGYIKGPLSTTAPKFVRSEGMPTGPTPPPTPAPPTPAPPALNFCTAADLNSNVVQQRRRTPSCSCRRREGKSATGEYECLHDQGTLVMYKPTPAVPAPPAPSLCTANDLYVVVQQRRRDVTCSCRRREGMSATGRYSCPSGGYTLTMN